MIPSRYATGYAFAFGDADPLSDGSYPWSNPFIGHKYFFQIGMPREELVKWFFQFTFAATSATIVSGAVAERCRFESYICYNIMLIAFVYPVVAHWVWSPFGWMSATRTAETASSGYTLLFGSGVYDFAGDGPVHMVGGFASLAGAWVLGARIGRFDVEGTPVDMPGHNASLTLLGVFLLWFGWFGFNPGSTNAILMPTTAGSMFKPGYSNIAASIAVNTTVSAAAATISTLIVAMLHTYLSLRVVVWDLIVAGNGALAGLVAITGPCAFVQTWGAWIIGAVAGGLYYGASKLILLKFKIDDPLDAIAVHAVSGMWGSIGGALLASPSLVTNWFGPLPGYDSVGEDGLGQRPYGLFMGGGGTLLGAHILYIIVVFAWVFGLMVPFFLLLRKAGILRVPPEAEAAGLDVSYHGGGSYPGHQEAHGGGSVAVSMGAAPKRDTAELARLIDRAVEKALSEVERRGWRAVSPDSKGATDEDVSQRGPAVATQSLADVRAAVQRNYAPSSPEGSGHITAAELQNGAAPLR